MFVQFDTSCAWHLRPLALIVSVAGLIGLGIQGCAYVKVRKVPTPTQYMRWTDAMQRRADGMDGFRFYLPRPFIAVFESFPVRTDVYLAQGVVSPDGSFVLIKEIVPESRFGTFKTSAHDLLELGRAEHKIPINVIKVPEPTQPTIDPGIISQALGADLEAAPDIAIKASRLGQIAELMTKGFDKETLDELVELVREMRTPTTQPARPLVTKMPPPKDVGKQQVRVTNDNAAFAFQPLRGNFDIAFLPDFEEQYVVSSAHNLGNVKVAVNLGQGWSLQGFDSLVDNSELVRRIYDLIDTAVQIAKSAAYPALGFQLPTDIEAQALGEGGMRRLPKERSLEALEPKPGTPVSLKLVVVHYAAKGLYPVIKPRELQERNWPQEQSDVALRNKDGTIVTSAAGQTVASRRWIDAKSRTSNDYCVLDLFRLFPQPTFTSEMDFGAIEQASSASGNPTGHYTVPRYPYQYISFNTFRYVAVEVIRPTTSDRGPFEHLYDATGTTGERGLARPKIPLPTTLPPDQDDGKARATIIARLTQESYELKTAAGTTLTLKLHEQKTLFVKSGKKLHAVVTAIDPDEGTLSETEVKAAILIRFNEAASGTNIRLEAAAINLKYDPAELGARVVK